MSEANMTDADIELFRTGVLPVADVPDDAIHLFCFNADVNHYNSLKLAQITAQLQYIQLNQLICMKEVDNQLLGMLKT